MDRREQVENKDSWTLDSALVHYIPIHNEVSLVDIVGQALSDQLFSCRSPLGTLRWPTCKDFDLPP